VCTYKPYNIVLIQKISKPSPWMVIGNSEEVGVQKPEFLKESMKLNWIFQGGGGGVKPKKNSLGIGSSIQHISCQNLLFPVTIQGSRFVKLL